MRVVGILLMLVMIKSHYGRQSILHLHGIVIMPRLLTSAQLPQNDAKGVDITLLIVRLASQHLRSCPLRRACLRLGAQPSAAPHP